MAGSHRNGHRAGLAVLAITACFVGGCRWRTTTTISPAKIIGQTCEQREAGQYPYTSPAVKEDAYLLQVLLANAAKDAVVTDWLGRADRAMTDVDRRDQARQPTATGICRSGSARTKIDKCLDQAELQVDEVMMKNPDLPGPAAQVVDRPWHDAAVLFVEAKQRDDVMFAARTVCVDAGVKGRSPIVPPIKRASWRHCVEADPPPAARC